MKIGLVQYNPVWESQEENKKKINHLIERDFLQSKNLPGEPSLLVFPEMTLTGFTMQSSKFGELLKGENFKYFSRLSLKHRIFIAAGLIEKENENYFNSLVVFNSEGELISKYRKIHPFTYSSEDKHYTRGKETGVVEIDGLKVGLSICYDLRFPELYRLYAKERVHLIIVIANWPEARIEHWRALLRARAIENQCYIAGVNRVGDDPKLYYPGFSSVCDLMGNEIVSSKDEEKIIYAEINKEKVEEVRKNLPFLDDIYLI